MALPPRAGDRRARIRRILQNLALNLMQQGAHGRSEHPLRRRRTASNRTRPEDRSLTGRSCTRCRETSRKPACCSIARRPRPPRRTSTCCAPDISPAPAERRKRSPFSTAAGTLNGDGQLERGRMLDRLGRHDEAWNDFVEGKRKLAARSRRHPLSGGSRRRVLRASEARSSRRERFALLPKAALRTDVPQPLFIMGFPRSGTTMVEQMLTSHPLVRAGGELSFIGELRTALAIADPVERSFSRESRAAR